MGRQPTFLRRDTRNDDREQVPSSTAEGGGGLSRCAPAPAAGAVPISDCDPRIDFLTVDFFNEGRARHRPIIFHGEEEDARLTFDLDDKLTPSDSRADFTNCPPIGSICPIAESNHSRHFSCTFFLGLLAMSLLCASVSAVPMPRSSLTDRGGYSENGFEDAFREEDVQARNTLDDDELEIIRRSVVQGLGLERIPDPSKANVSQAEYERAHREYLKNVHLSQQSQGSTSRRKLHVFHATGYPGNRSSSEREGCYRNNLFFPVEIPVDDEVSSSVDHATLRFLLEGRYSERSERSELHLEVLVYLKTISSRELIDRKTFLVHNPREARWLEFDSTEAASLWLETGLENLGLELEFLRNGQPVEVTFTSAVLNVFTNSEPVAAGRKKRSSPEELMSLHKGRRTKCKGENKKCCRHELTVMFKDLKGFEFIVYPKTFDAGYCKGRCPPRYNPAHHHALLQSLLWKEDRKKVPKPCCAPSKLDQLMIVYFDENDSTQLKVSYWKNIQVLECACS